MLGLIYYILLMTHFLFVKQIFKIFCQQRVF